MQNPLICRRICRRGNRHQEFLQDVSEVVEVRCEEEVFGLRGDLFQLVLVHAKPNANGENYNAGRRCFLGFFHRFLRFDGRPSIGDHDENLWYPVTGAVGRREYLTAASQRVYYVCASAFGINVTDGLLQRCTIAVFVEIENDFGLCAELYHGNMCPVAGDTKGACKTLGVFQHEAPVLTHASRLVECQ